MVFSIYSLCVAGLTITQRKRFEAKGTFEELAGKDGVIDVQEFQRLMDDILTEHDGELMRIQSIKVQYSR